MVTKQFRLIMNAATITSRIKLGTLLAEIASAMQNLNGSYVLDLETLEVVETTTDNRYETDHVAISEESWDLFPEWAQNAPPVSMLTEHQPDRFMTIPRISEKDLKALMRQFAQNIGNEAISKKMERSLNSSQPFEGFKKELSFHTGYRTQWLNFKHKFGLKQAKVWMKKQGLL